MQSILKIGLVIADMGEFAPFASYAEGSLLESGEYLGRQGKIFTVKGEKREAEVYCIICNVGKVNAAAVTAHLIDKGCEIILNFGLSGGVSGVGRGELTIANRYLEHDFDLTTIGYAPCEKPGQDYIYEADSRLLELFTKIIPSAVVGTAVCGDRFICNEADRLFLKETFGAVSCDMETGAIAAVCKMANVPFIALRRISDDAGSDAESSYRQMNESPETILADSFYNALCSVVDEW